MIIDLPLHYRATVVLRGDPSPRDVIMQAREPLLISGLDDAEAPVAVRWRPSAGGDWTWTREIEGRHVAPLPLPADAPTGMRPALAHLLRKGWADLVAEPLPQAEHMDIADHRIRRLVDDDKGQRIHGMHKRAALITAIDGILHVPCEEPVLVETGNAVEVRLGRSLDWVRVHPLSEGAAALASIALTGSVGTMAHAVEILRPQSLTVDRGLILGKVVRKAHILVRRACESDASAARLADLSGAALDRDAPWEAADAMRRCLETLHARVDTAEQVRDFAGRTIRYLVRHAPPALARLSA